MISHLLAAGSRLPVTLLHADAEEQSSDLRHQLTDDIEALPNGSLYAWYENGCGNTLRVDGALSL